MIDETVHDKRITELEDKLKDHERCIAELKHELDEYKEKYPNCCILEMRPLGCSASRLVHARSAACVGLMRRGRRTHPPLLSVPSPSTTPRARGERPGGSRAAEQRDEVPPVLTELHAIPHDERGPHRRISN
jgi:hypothetical protein